jgi:hypothetical protein
MPAGRDSEMGIGPAVARDAPRASEKTLARMIERFASVLV